MVITIVVVIILAAAVILSLNNNNPITNAKKATFQSDLKTYADDLSLYIANEYTKSMGAYNPNDINAGKENMSTYIPSMKEKYHAIVEIQNGKLVVREGITGEESDWAREVLESSSFGTNGSTVANVAKVNRPMITTGLTPITFNDSGVAQTITETDSDWYAYINQGAYMTDGKTSQWANAQSEDGSQWVWIPRYAYKIPSGAGTNTASPIEVVFLRGTSDDYYDETTKTYLTAKRAGEIGAGVTEYMVHPAFTNENNSTQVNGTLNNGFKNGGWDKEIPGIWVAKYEAGFAGQNSIPAHTAGKENASIIYGGATTTKAYPVFKPNAFSYGSIDVGDTYALSRVLNSSNNPYGLTTSADTHLIKNSEWGAVVYLTQSKYGRNGNELRINNIDSGNKGLTGAGATTKDASSTTTITADNIYNGQYGKLASTTGNLYGIYDISGGNLERTAGYLMNDNNNLKSYGKKLVDINNDGTIDNEATKYISIYKLGVSDTSSNNFAQAENKARKGEAIWETFGWNSDNPDFSCTSAPFFSRGGGYHNTSSAGAFCRGSSDGSAASRGGFRPVFTLTL